MPPSIYGWLVAGLWLGWVAYWIASARNLKPVRRRESLSSQLAHRAPLVVGAVLIAFHDLPPAWLNERFVPRSWTAYWFGLILIVAGLAFAVWARRHLGRNWSGAVTLKEDHELIRSGPYRLARHPIYSGILLALLGTAVVIGQWRALIGFVLGVISLLIKMRAEERFMDETFPDQYARYRREVPALIPHIVSRAK